MEAIILLPDQATVDIFRRGEGALDQDQPHDSASSFTGPAAACKAYAIADDAIFILCMSGKLSHASMLYLHLKMQVWLHPDLCPARASAACCSDSEPE